MLLLKMLTKNDPGNYDTIVLVRLSAEGLENDQEPADAILSAYVLAFRERIFSSTASLPPHPPPPHIIKINFTFCRVVK